MQKLEKIDGNKFYIIPPKSNWTMHSGDAHKYLKLTLNFSFVLKYVFLNLYSLCVYLSCVCEQNTKFYIYKNRY